MSICEWILCQDSKLTMSTQRLTMETKYGPNKVTVCPNRFCNLDIKSFGCRSDLHIFGARNLNALMSVVGAVSYSEHCLVADKVVETRCSAKGNESWVFSFSLGVFWLLLVIFFKLLRSRLRPKL